MLQTFTGNAVIQVILCAIRFNESRVLTAYLRKAVCNNLDVSFPVSIAEEGAGSRNGWPPRVARELILAQRTCLPQDTDLLSLAPPSQDRVTTLNEIGSPGLRPIPKMVNFLRAQCRSSLPLDQGVAAQGLPLRQGQWGCRAPSRLVPVMLSGAACG